MHKQAITKIDKIRTILSHWEVNTVIKLQLNKKKKLMNT